MFRCTLVLSLSASIFAFACAPSTTYNRGVDVSYHPSARADAAPRLVPSAIELVTDADEQTIRTAGGEYLGELEVTGARAGVMFAGSGASTLAGRVSIEAANRGATHFYTASTRVEHDVEANGHSLVPTSKTHVRFVLFRVEPDAWQRLPASLRPEAAPATVASR